jgi:hypothetical protein
LEQRVDSLEARWGKNDEIVRELRDAVRVTAELENTQARRTKELAYEIAVHADWLREHKEAMRDLDRRIAGLASGIGEFISRSVPPTQAP